jgi:hypothetical protein
MNDCPLPLEPVTLAIVNYETNCPADRVLTSILMIEEQMANIEASVTPYLRNLLEQREKLLARAKKENIKEDSEALLIETEGKKNRNEISDLESFELQFPGAIEKIRTEQRRKLTVKYDKDLAKVPDEDIGLGLADEIVGKNKITEFVGYKPQTITYEIRRR